MQDTAEAGPNREIRLRRFQPRSSRTPVEGMHCPWTRLRFIRRRSLRLEGINSGGLISWGIPLHFPRVPTGCNAREARFDGVAGGGGEEQRPRQRG